MTRQRRFEARYSAQRAAEVNRQLKEYISERERATRENDLARERNTHDRAAEVYDRR